MIVATAGHVDHGKTLLVKALTGVETDRLPEEKKRGLTIDLGFAYHDLGGSEPTGFIDVPGHERFIRTMLAGVSGIDFVVFVIAADDGPMPQTAEHLAIMDLLGVRQGVIALTKIDRVSAERLDDVCGEISHLISNTSLSDASIIPVSAMEGTGIETLRASIADAAKAMAPREPSGHFRLAIDRSFILSGAGRIVTGTVFSGRAELGDQLLIAPARTEVRVREIHAQNQVAERAQVGQRCALNIVGADLRRYEISRGDWLVAPPACFSVNRFDATVRVLADEPRALKNRTPVHVHVGAADVTGRLVTLEEASIEPGNEGLVQVQLDKPITMVRGDHLILRDQSASRTIGGGIVLDPAPLKRGRARDQRLAYLRAQTSSEPARALQRVFETLDSLPFERFQQAWNLRDDETQQMINDVDMRLVADRDTTLALTPSRWRALSDLVVVSLKRWHGENPDRVGINEAELRLQLGERVSVAVYDALVAELLETKTIERDAGTLRLPGHAAVSSEADQKIWAEISSRLTAAGAKVPVVHDLATEIGMPYGELNKFLMKMAKEGRLIRMSEKRFFMPGVLRGLVDIVEDLVATDPKNSFSVKAYRDKAGIGRNAVIEILEYFDRVGYTRRLDQVRIIRKPAEEAFGAVIA